MPAGPVRFVGTSQLARELGVTSAYISQELNKGMTADQIREKRVRSLEKKEARAKARGLEPARVVIGRHTKQGGRPVHVEDANRGVGTDALVPRSPLQIPSSIPMAERGPIVERVVEQAALVPRPYVGRKKTRSSMKGGLPPAALPSLGPTLADHRQAAQATWGVKETRTTGNTTADTFYAAQARKEVALADQNELKAAVLRGELVPVRKVNEHFGKVIVRAREIGLRIGGELGDALAAETVPARCAALVDAEVRRMLDTLALIEVAPDALTLELERTA